MLARTADNLFWLSRYMERADYLARIVNVANRLQSMPAAYGGERNEWESALTSAGAIEAFRDAYDKLDPANAIEFLVYDTTNPSSIVSCIEAARSNARAVRTALTVETWEMINSGWLEMKRIQSRRGDRVGFGSAQLSSFLELVSKISLDVDGSAYRTMLRNDAYWFSRLGLYVERADNTARLLDVKYSILLPDTESVGGSLDYFQWTAILRAVSALTSYHWVYRQSIKPWLIADLLILRPEMPRSLIACYGEIARFLDAIGRAYGRQGASQRHARHVLTRLENASIKDVFSGGLHEFITVFIDDNNRLGGTVAEQYLVS
jgi:uncharacterized alpha-E superfamily protein